ncbi:hypothetical protein N9Y92_01000 [Chlamydiales bacterium]|nr:hypothetical protein [Chlamydiales bacterium]
MDLSPENYRNNKRTLESELEQSTETNFKKARLETLTPRIIAYVDTLDLKTGAIIKECLNNPNYTMKIQEAVDKFGDEDQNYSLFQFFLAQPIEVLNHPFLRNLIQVAPENNLLLGDFEFLLLRIGFIALENLKLIET